ncbi:hypothetical protein [Algimonas arctica]|nr:hypothetical protein [Algimonas arctica]
MAPDEAIKFAFKAIQSNINAYNASLNCDDFDYNLSRHLGNAAKRAVIISIHGNDKSRYASFLRSLKQVSSKHKKFDFTSLAGALLYFKRHLIDAGKYSSKSAEVGFINELSAMIKSGKLFISDKVMRDLLIK